MTDRIPSLLFALFAFFVVACEPLEEPIVIDTKNEVIHTVVMGSDYGKQVFFVPGDTNSNQTISKMDWDIALELDGGEWYIQLNAGRNMFISKTNNNLEHPLDTSGSSFRFDYSSGNKSDYAISDPLRIGDKFLIDLGYNLDAQPLGVAGIEIMEISAGAVHLQGIAHDGTSLNVTANKQPGNPKTGVSLLRNTTFPFPPSTSYDLVATQYISFVDSLDYLVSGILIGPTAIQCYEIAGTPFGQVDLSLLSGLTPNGAKDAIGNAWKSYNFQTGLYEMEDRVYLLHYPDERWVKLQFLDFYGNQGEKGSISFLCEELR